MAVVELLMQLQAMPATAQVWVEVRNAAGRTERFPLAGWRQAETSKDVLFRIGDNSPGE